MANITYRESSDPTLPENTVTKASPLTNLEVDANFKSLNDDIQTRATISSVTSSLTTIQNTVNADSLAYAIALG